MVSLLRTESSKQLEQLKDPILLVITGKPQILVCNISGTKGWILILFFSTFSSSSAALSHNM